MCLVPWRVSDLTVNANAPLLFGMPVGYASTFGYNRVIYIGKDQHVHQLTDVQTTTYWADLDLFKTILFAIAPLADF
jgi:hypothetical protein